MGAFGRMASFFHEKPPKERRLTLNINLDLKGNGATKTAPVDFMVDRLGRTRLLTEKELPKEIKKKYDDTLLAAVVSVTGWEVVKTEQGMRLRGPNGIVEYEFLITLKDGRTGIPYRVKPLSGRREYGDLRNYMISSYLEGATISIKINSVNCDLKNSELGEITRKVRHFEIYNLDGSETIVYKTEAQPTLEKALYREYESYRKLFIVKHLLPVKPVSFIRFSYSVFDSPGRIPWLPSTQALASSDETDGRGIALPRMIRANPSVFGNGFEAIADALPEAQASPQLFEIGLAQAEEHQISSEKHASGIAIDSAGLENVGFLAAAAGRLAIESKIIMPAKQRENNRVERGNGSEERVKRHHNLEGETGSSRRSGKRKRNFKPAPFSALSSFKAVIFDLDGVIVDSEMVHPRTFELALVKYGVKINNRHWKRAYTGIGSHAIFKDLVKKYSIPEDAQKLVKRRNAIYLKEIKRNKLPVISGFPEVHQLLAKNGIKEAVASGGHRNHIEESLRSAGLRNVPFVSIENVKRGKPAPDTFLLAAKRLGVLPSECIVFEDSLSGVAAAASAGMPCVALSTTMPKRELGGKAALVVRDFRSKKLRRLLDALLAKKKNVRPSRRRKRG